MKQIIVLGRGGQGAVTSSQVLAIAAFKDGKYSQAFPNFGVERTGAPVRSYARIDDKQITLREQVKEADYCLILDPTLVKNLTETITKLIIVNSNKKPEELGINTKALSGGQAKIMCIDITKVALEKIGKPFVNISALGAFAAITGEVSLKALEEAIGQQMGSKGAIVEKNLAAIREVYDIAKKSN
jgi:pyruvate ferredoxin oxidoreductase gamma subunit